MLRFGWSGQYEYMLRARQRLTYLLPLTLGIITLLLYINFRSVSDLAIVMGSLPFALVGSVWLMYLQGFNFSIAAGIGFIALAGVAVETSVIMLVYLNKTAGQQSDNTPADAQPTTTIINAAERRVRPVMMTSATVILGLLPIMFGSGTGTEVMSRIAAPMVGGMVSAILLTLFIIPALYRLRQRHRRPG